MFRETNSVDVYRNFKFNDMQLHLAIAGKCALTTYTDQEELPLGYNINLIP